MPVMNGVVATQILRKHGVNLPIVAVTGNVSLENLRTHSLAKCCAQAGFGCAACEVPQQHLTLFLSLLCVFFASLGSFRGRERLPDGRRQ